MKKYVCFMFLTVFMSVVPARADRELSRDEILSILKSLTDQPRNAWITSGSVVAMHQEFRAARTLDANEVQAQINTKISKFQADSNSDAHDDFYKLKLDTIPFNIRYRLMNSYTMESTETVHIDGEKSYWQIEIDSRVDSIKPPLELANNYMTDQFDLNGNRSRIFVWDGQQYSRYMRPVNHAMITDAGKLSREAVVKGPLTAGIIPWGTGNLTYEKLAAAATRATEIVTGCQKTINLSVDITDSFKMLFVLDPAKDYAVLSNKIDHSAQLTAVSTYGNFQMINGKWIPTTIFIEKYKGTVTSQNLIANDLWNITSLIPAKPSADKFALKFEKDALVEYKSSLNPKTLIYYRSDPNGTKVNTDELLIDKLAIAGSGANHNCGSAAMKYVCQKFGKSISDQSLVSQLVKGTDASTNFYDMKMLAQAMGLYATVLHTDLKTLKNLSGCQAILHFPQKSHYVVLGEKDDEYARVVDLTSNKFYTRYRIWELNQEWTDGIALVISTSPIEIGTSSVINDSQLQSLQGKGGYACTRLLQEYEEFLCQIVEGYCVGDQEVWEERWGCGSAPSGTCATGSYIRYSTLTCINDIFAPGSCTSTGSWIAYYMTACG